MIEVEGNDRPEFSGEAETPKVNDSKIPDWLTAQLFEELLKATIADYKQIKTFRASPALSPGENYATVMLRVEIDVELHSGQTKYLSYMMKLHVESVVLQELMVDINIFELETAMYNEVVPELEEMYREAGMEVKFCAAHYKLPTAQDYVLLEDLRTRGFKNANRLEGLDMEHTRRVLKKLAQWHAASAVRVETKGKYADKFAVGAFNETRKEFLQQVMAGMSAPFMQCIKTYAGHESYIESIEKLLPKITDEFLKTCNIDPTEFNVLNHGDCWSNNIMFQYDTLGNIKETYMVDFQMPKYGTPAQDLLYVLLASTKFEQKLKQFEYFVKYYHDNLVEHLQLLKYPKKLPTLKEIHAQLYKHGILGYCVATGIMAVVLLDPTDTANMDNFVSDSPAGTDFKLLMYSHDRYRKHIEVILPWLHNRGALEC